MPSLPQLIQGEMLWRGAIRVITGERIDPNSGQEPYHSHRPVTDTSQKTRIVVVGILSVDECQWLFEDRYTFPWFPGGVVVSGSNHATNITSCDQLLSTL